MKTKIIASGLAYDPKTGQWTKPIQYEARTQMEAIRWCNMNRDWFKSLKIETHTTF